ncbi:MAG: DUF547 domain-containing protein [Geminicoccaceae bacterium]
MLFLRAGAVLFSLVWFFAGIHAAGLAANGDVDWSRWQAHDPRSDDVINHELWGLFLDRQLVTGSDGINRIAYADTGDQEKRLLDQYLEHMSTVAISTYDRNEQLAFWINLFNALTVRLALEHYPIGSMHEIVVEADGRTYKVWNAKLIEIEGIRLSLNDIEHRIVRATWRDPRINYALSHGSLGCANIRKQPYRGSMLDRQLSYAAIDFINHPRGVSISGRHLQVSSIYRWFREDFGGDDRAIIRHLAAFAKPALAYELQHFNDIDAHDYDWALNALY